MNSYIVTQLLDGIEAMAENEANTIMGTVNDEDYRRVLRNNEKKITKLINPNYLLPVLRANGLLTKSELQQLEDMPMLQNEANRKAQLFQILLGKEEGNTCTLNSFIKALQEEGEHMGHKSLAIQLLSELSNLKTVPPVPPRKMTLYHAHTLPRHDQLSSETEWHTSLTTTTRSFSEPEVSSNQLQVAMKYTTSNSGIQFTYLNTVLYSGYILRGEICEIDSKLLLFMDKFSRILSTQKFSWKRFSNHIFKIISILS